MKCIICGEALPRNQRKYCHRCKDANWRCLKCPKTPEQKGSCDNRIDARHNDYCKEFDELIDLRAKESQEFLRKAQKYVDEIEREELSKNRDLALSYLDNSLKFLDKLGDYIGFIEVMVKSFESDKILQYKNENNIMDKNYDYWNNAYQDFSGSLDELIKKYERFHRVYFAKINRMRQE